MRQILHLDLDAFYATVEALLNPELRGKPLIVAMGDITSRGVVSTASYEARKFGVHSAMPLREAYRLCPQAVIVPVRHKIYSEHSHRVMDLLREISPLVEQVSIDEAYIEIPPEQDGVAAAREIQRRIHDELHLSCTIAVASNKLVSKIACNTVKPRGFIVIPAGTEEQFLAPLPVGKIPGAGQVTRAKLAAKWKVETIGDLARVPVQELTAEFGKHGAYLSSGAHGWDDSPIVTDSKPKSISQENTFERDLRAPDVLEKYLDEMSIGVARELEREGYLARTVVLKLRYADFTTITRQTTLRVPTADEATIRKCARDLLTQHWQRTRAVRLLGVGVHNLVEKEGTWQMELGME
ncbi:MAG TPA: DNA polymerase IV [Anaerolineae bacterium]|nr:DNA polymerase IV [Anaerolineae bacterium]